MTLDPINFDAALGSLPHGPEFRFLDRLTALDPGRSAGGEYHVRGDEPFLRGHFPGRPIFPGVLMIEAGAQLAGAAIQAGASTDPGQQELRLTAVRGVKISGTATPGQTIRLEAKILGQHAQLIQAEIIASVNSKMILKGEVTLSRSSMAG